MHYMHVGGILSLSHFYFSLVYLILRLLYNFPRCHFSDKVKATFPLEAPPMQVELNVLVGQTARALEHILPTASC